MVVAESTGINLRHVKVLLKKDALTLKRNWIFALTFIVLPVSMMLSFSYLESFVEGQLAPEQHNFIRK